MRAVVGALIRVGGLVAAAAVGWFVAGWVVYRRQDRRLPHPAPQARAGVVLIRGGRR